MEFLSFFFVQSAATKSLSRSALQAIYESNSPFLDRMKHHMEVCSNTCVVGYLYVLTPLFCVNSRIEPQNQPQRIDIVLDNRAARTEQKILPKRS